MRHLPVHVMVVVALVVFFRSEVACVDAVSSTLGNSRSDPVGATSLVWRVPRHLAAQRDDLDWTRRGLANDESLTSLIDRDKEGAIDGRGDDEVDALGLIARGLYLLLLFL